MLCNYRNNLPFFQLLDAILSNPMDLKKELHGITRQNLINHIKSANATSNLYEFSHFSNVLHKTKLLLITLHVNILVIFIIVKFLFILFMSPLLTATKTKRHILCHSHLLSVCLKNCKI